jgi:hypothetical protein
MSQESTQLRDQAHAETLKAQEKLDAGELDASLAHAEEAEKHLARAQDLDSAESKIKNLQMNPEDMPLWNSTPLGEELTQIAKETQSNAKAYKTDYKPHAWIKGDNGQDLSASSQPEYVMKDAGSNHHEAKKVQGEAFRTWISYKTEEAFRLNADPVHVKAMNETTDSQGTLHNLPPMRVIA